MSTILIDMDDTIEYLLDAWIKRLNIKFDRSVSRQAVTRWEIWEFFPTLTKEEVFSPLSEEDFWETVEPRKDAIVYVKKLIDLGNDVYIVTSSHYSTIKDKIEKCLFKHFPYIQWQSVIITDNKQMIKGDWLIDDNPNNLINGDYKKILITSSHNKNFDEASIGAIRFDSWYQIYNYIYGE